MSTIEYMYCTRCGKKVRDKGQAATKYFFKSKSVLNGNYGFLHNCIDCCHILYMKFHTEYKDHQYCVYLMCRTYDYPYECGIAASAVRQHEEKGTGRNAFGVYLGQMWKTLIKKKITATSFNEWRTEFEKKEILPTELTGVLSKEELEEKWGDWYNHKDYIFLENKYNELSKDLIVDEAISELIKQVCYACLEQRQIRARMSGQISRDKNDDERIDKLTKSIQELIKNLGMDAKSKVEKDNGKLVNSLGMAVADYEEYDAIDILGKMKTLEDVNNIEGYLYDYVFRPTENQIMGNRNFKLEKTTEDENFDYLDGKIGDNNG